MAASLGIHAADIRVVSVYEGSVIVDFQIISNILDDTPLDLDVVQESFATVVSTMSTFMGSPVLNAVATGIQLVTPNTELDENGNIVGAEAFNLDAFGLDNERKAEVKPPEVQVQIKYKEKVSAIQAQKSAKAYMIILLGLTIVLAIVFFAVAIYTKINSDQARSIVMKEVPERVEQQEEFNDMDHEIQFDPKKQIVDAGFGGVNFKKPSTKKKQKVSDDIEKIKLENNIKKMIKVRKADELETGRELNSPDSLTNGNSVNMSSSQQESFYSRDSALKPLKQESILEAAEKPKAGPKKIKIKRAKAKDKVNEI